MVGREKERPSRVLSSPLMNQCQILNHKHSLERALESRRKSLLRFQPQRSEGHALPPQWPDFPHSTRISIVIALSLSFVLSFDQQCIRLCTVQGR